MGIALLFIKGSNEWRIGAKIQQVCRNLTPPTGVVIPRNRRLVSMILEKVL